MKKVKLDKLSQTPLRERVAELAASLNEGEGVDMREAAEELGAGFHGVRQQAININANAVFYNGRHRRAYLVNPKFNK